MKRNFIIRNIILTIIISVLIIGMFVYFINKDKRKYEIEKIENYNYFVLKHEDKEGVIDSDGNIIIDTKYDEVKIPNPQKAVFACYESENIKFLDENNNPIFNVYEKVEPIRLNYISSDLMYEKSVLKYSENGKYGLINFKGKKLTKAVFEEINSLPYKEGELLVKQNEKYGVINIKGNKLVNSEYDKIEIDGFYNSENKYKDSGYIVSNKTQEGYRYGYTKNDGKLILKLEYNDLSRITQIDNKEDIYLIAAKNGQYGVIKNDKHIIENEYQSITYDSANRLFVIEKSKKYGIAAIEGNVIVPTQYDQIDVNGIYLYAKNEQGTTVYNVDGTQANIDANTTISNTSNEKYKIRITEDNNTKYGIISKDGKQIIEEKYNYLEYLYDNYFIVSDENSKSGVVSDKNEVKIEIENDSLQKISNTNIVEAIKGNITKLYSCDMKKICEMQDAVVNVKDNYVEIYNDQEVKYISLDGKEIQNTEVFKDIVLFAKKQNGKWGFVNKEGKTVVNFKYDKVTEFNEYGFAGIKQDGKWGSIDKNANVIVEPIYEIKEEQRVSFIGKYYQVKYGFGEIYYTDAKQ